MWLHAATHCNTLLYSATLQHTCARCCVCVCSTPPQIATHHNTHMTRINQWLHEFLPRFRSQIWVSDVTFEHKGHFQIPTEMVLRGGRRQSICQPALHISQRNIFLSSKGLRVWHTWHWVSLVGGLPMGLGRGGISSGGTETWCLRRRDWTG